MIPDLNRLKVFSHVYANRSVSKAARELNLTQPAVSQQLKKLEKELRIPLFTRMNRRILPTPAAERLYERIVPFISELQKEVKYLRRPLDTPYGLLRIGAPPAFGEKYLPIICSHFRLRFPAVTFRLQLDNSETLLTALSQGNLDIVAINQPGYQRKKKLVSSLFYTSDKLFQEELILACSKGYYLRNMLNRPDYPRLLQLDYLTPDDHGSAIIQWFQHHFNKVPRELDYAMSINNHQAILAGIRCGMGLGIIPKHLVEEEIRSAAIKPIITGRKHMTNQLLLAQLKNKETTLTEKSFIDVLKKELIRAGLT